ncbi:MAG TPA: hypothetical protein VGU27_11975, partial [Candidatus Eisenbacteria bacterium]|nr:hypothetical protein [Candidatus Eisenbacteria bacterium]
TYAYPAEDAIEGPLSALGWGGNGPPVATIAYDVYVGTDSALVDTRQVPPQPRTPFVQLLPAARWPLGAVFYWAVTAVQLQTGERLNGALRRFRTLPADTPVDSLTLAVGAWGGASRTNASLQRCSLNAIFSGPDFTAGVEWDLAPLPAGSRLAAARLVLHTAPAYAAQLAAAAPQVFAPQNPWLACACGFPGPPYHDPTGFLANGVPGPDPLAVQFASDRLAAFLEAEESGLLSGGTTFASNVPFEYFMSVGTAPYAVVTYYRSGP